MFGRRKKRKIVIIEYDEPKEKKEPVQEEEPEYDELRPGRAMLEREKETMEYYRQLHDYYLNLYR